MVSKQKIFDAVTELSKSVSELTLKVTALSGKIDKNDEDLNHIQQDVVKARADVSELTKFLVSHNTKESLPERPPHPNNKMIDTLSFLVRDKKLTWKSISSDLGISTTCLQNYRKCPESIPSKYVTALKKLIKNTK